VAAASSAGPDSPSRTTALYATRVVPCWLAPLLETLAGPIVGPVPAADVGGVGDVDGGDDEPVGGEQARQAAGPRQRPCRSNRPVDPDKDGVHGGYSLRHLAMARIGRLMTASPGRFQITGCLVPATRGEGLIVPRGCFCPLAVTPFEPDTGSSWAHPGPRLRGRTALPCDATSCAQSGLT
jgi:hypothetical protein